ncbi:ATP-binding protein [Candidatus Eisenbacteria bacterium]|uniref:ATP-binding protein n=1 Tax=Eiseniibacteriota bacterium TaxID=2212470 RepID=A0ABV6YN01_UNCEI
MNSTANLTRMPNSNIDKAEVPSPMVGVLRLDATVGYLSEPEHMECTRCGKPMEKYKCEKRWPRHNQAKKRTDWLEVWPQYTCEECLRELRTQAPVPLGRQMTAAGLYGKNRGHSFSSFQPTDQVLARAFRAAQDFAKTPRGNLWLFGSPGTGKSHLAAAIVLTQIENGKNPIFAESAVFLQDLIDSFLSVDSPALRESKWATCSLLVLDDLGTEKLTERGLELLTVVINARNLHNRPTVVTSNLEPRDLHDKASERLISRLVDSGRIVSTGKQDWRKRRKG